MADNKKQKTNSDNQFRVDRVKRIEKMYSDEQSVKRSRDRSTSYAAGTYTTAAELRKALNDGIANHDNLVELSRKLYSINPIYSGIIDYLANMFSWRYKVLPHKVYSRSKAKLRKDLKDEDFTIVYNTMLEAVDGLSIETKFPMLLTLLYMTGAVYIATVKDEDSMTVDSILLPEKYCRKIAETQYGTAIIDFDFSYFDTLGLSATDLNEFLKQFPKEFKTNYNRYKRNPNDRWQTLDPHFSTGILLNNDAIPTLLYLYGGILDYEKYQDNELERNENSLKYIVAHKMPIYQDQMVFEMDEVEAIHKSIAKVVNTNSKARLITTFGDIHIEKVSENDTSENQVLSKAFKAIFNNAGFNSGLFTSESVEALKMSLIRDKGMVWYYVQQFSSFYSIAINNWFDFKLYEADIDILPISPYTYNDDIKIYKDNATLGVGKLDYLIASGIKQKNIQDQLNLEKFLNLGQITPMQTSYTQTAEDRQEVGKSDSSNQDKDEKPLQEDTQSDSGIEPTEDGNSSSSEVDNSSN